MIFPPQELRLMSSSDPSLRGRKRLQRTETFLWQYNKFQVNWDISSWMSEGGKGRVQDLVKAWKRFCRLSSASSQGSSHGESHCPAQGARSGLARVWHEHTHHFLTWFGILGHTRGCHPCQHPHPHQHPHQIHVFAVRLYQMAETYNYIVLFAKGGVILISPLALFPLFPCPCQKKHT